MLPLDDIRPSLPAALRPVLESVIKARLAAKTELKLPAPLKGSDEEAVITNLLQQYCCSGIGYEFMNCATDDERDFFTGAIEQLPEKPQQSNQEADDEMDILWCWEQVARAYMWEQLLSRRYPYCKRFSLEGLESGILALNTILDTFASSNADSPVYNSLQPRVVMGSLHRGRVNILHTVLQNSVSSLLQKWDESDGPTYDDINEGHSADVMTKSDQSLHLSLVAMPAHLESQDAAVNGKAYGHMVLRWLAQHEQSLESLPSPPPLQQTQMDPCIAQSILPLMVHGDASFAGEGIVSETLQLSTFDGFACGGTIHVIFNNQIGYTVETQQLRSPRHRLVQVTDIALGIRAPVLHVNADRPQDVWRASRLATLYRQRFGKDVVIDLVGYRRHGHNEADEPRITNVAMWQQIDAKDPVVNIHNISSSVGGKRQKQCVQRMEQLQAEYASDSVPSSSSIPKGEWRDLLSHASFVGGVTGVHIEALQAAFSTISSVPAGFTLTKPTHKAISRRAEISSMLKKDPDCKVTIDWATAELLALSTLAREGHFVRLCGQDSQRGTFSQRHAVWHDAVTGHLHYALPPLVQVVNSPLSELGVIGFEHGVSMASPNLLVLWEAQFGDFTNNGQVLIDTMISSEKEKFGLESNLALLLPHGYDGMGPEHSSARLERFLSLHTDTPEMAQQIDNDLERYLQSNFTVLYPSTPSNYFHALRRSFSWPFRRPMVILTPKRTLRLAEAASPASDFLHSENSQTSFSPVLDDPRKLELSQVVSIALCSGEIFYNVLELVHDLPDDVSQTVAIIRVEELAPFPLRQLLNLLQKYPMARRAVWVQEEPQNMGALSFTAPFLTKLPPHIFIDTPISRAVSAAPAVGVPSKHKADQSVLLSTIRAWIARAINAISLKS